MQPQNMCDLEATLGVSFSGLFFRKYIVQDAEVRSRFFSYIPLKSYKHISDYATYMKQYPTTKTIPLGVKNCVYLYGN